MTLPSASIAARARWIEAGPFGSQPVPWSRVYCSRTGWPTALASTAASIAAIAGIVAAVGAGPGTQIARTLSGGRPSMHGDAVAHEVRLLRAGPAGDAAVLDLDHARRPDPCGMRLERPFVLGLDHARRGLERLVDVAGRLAFDLALAHRRLADVVVDARPGLGNGGSTSDHSTLSFSAAWIASHSLSATTPRKSFSQTTLAPGNVLDRALVDLDRHRARDRRDGSCGRAPCRAP